MVAHRGTPEEAPENTLPSFRAALATGAPVLECDVHASRDGVVVVIHDATLDRTTDAHGAVAERDWAELSRVDAGYPRRFGARFRDTRLPRLEELLDLARGRAQVMVEVKTAAVGAPSGGIEERVLLAARRTGTMHELGVIAMAPRALERIRALAPRVPTGLVLRRHGGRGAVGWCARWGVQFLIAPSERLLRAPAWPAEARAARLRLGAYVVNDRPTLAALVGRGVESLASDRPRQMQEALLRLTAGTERAP